MASIDITTYDNDDQLIHLWCDDGRHFVILLTDEDALPIELLRKAAASAASASTMESAKAAFQSVIDDDGRFDPLISMM